MKFRSYKTLYVYVDEYTSFHVIADQIVYDHERFKFFHCSGLVVSVPQYLVHHIEYFTSIFDLQTVYLSKTELLRECLV